MRTFGVQFRMARAAIGWSSGEASKKIPLALGTLRKLERADEIIKLDTARGRSGKGTFEAEGVNRMVALYTAHGVEFLAPHSGLGPGVRFKAPKGGV